MFPESELVVDVDRDNGERAYATGCVFENGLYQITLVDYGDREIKYGEVFIDDQPFAELELISESDGRHEYKFSFRTQYGIKDKGYPFLMMIDSIRIKLFITYEDDTSAILASDKLLVTSKTEKDQKNIDNMLYYIASKDGLNEYILSDGEEKTIVLSSLNRFLKNLFRVFRVYRPQYRRAYNSTSRQRGLIYDDNLGKSFLGLRHRLPIDTMAAERDDILKFFHLLYDDMKRMYSEINRIIEEYVVKYKKLTDTIPEGFSAPIIVTQKLRIDRCKIENNKLRHNIETLEEILKENHCVNTFTSFKPSLTREKYINPIFWDMMAEWNRNRTFNLNHQRFFLKIDSLDRLYEYYSLSRLLNFFKDMGYSPDAEEDNSYQYCAEDRVFENEKTLCNTFYRQKEGYKLTLYYQPLISRELSENGITLLRTSGGDNSYSTYNKTGEYYSPDFIIKLEGDRTRYLILDSKFQTRNTILKGHMDEVISKYFIQVRDADGSRNQMVYILQGRSDENLYSWSYENSINLGDKFISDFGIIPFSPEVNNNYELQRLMKHMENECNKKNL